MHLRHKFVRGTGIALKICGRDFPSFPVRFEFHERGNKAMRIIQKFIFTFAIAACMTLAVSAQKNDDQKKPTPPKPPPPVINPGEGKKPPKGEDKPKKPSYSLLSWKNEATKTI